MRTISLLFIALIATGTAHAQLPVRSLLEMRQENLVMQHWDISCGAAALATILTFERRFPVTEEEVAFGMLHMTDPSRVRDRGGFSLLDMKRYAAQFGFESDGYKNMQLADLAMRVPMIVPIRVRGYDHFIVVRKVDDEEVHIGDPGFGNYRLPRARFAAVWTGIGFTVGEKTGTQQGEQ